MRMSITGKVMMAAVAGFSLCALGGTPDFVNRRATRVQLWFDTEDYTLDKSNDAIRELANIMTEEGVRGHFNIAGYLARVILENRRDDVREALKPHLVGTLSLYHSRHPNITELTDLEDYDEAYRRCLAEEAEGFGYLKAAFGLQDQFLSCYPGNGSSYVALDVHADLGSHFHGGLGALDNLKRGDAMWYQNIRQILYNSPLNMEEYVLGRIDDGAFARGLDACAEFEAVVFYLHPHMLIRCQHWDIDNFLKGNNVTFGKWKTPELRTPAFTAQCYRNFRAFIRKVKADSRFTFTDCERLLATQEPRTAIWAEDVPAIRAALRKDFGPVSSPASWCVADCFQAAVKFLCGEKKHVPGKVYGFLERPVGVKAKTVVKAADLRAAARKIVFRRHLPVAYEVGGVTLGPADFLFAALEVLETGADEVTVEPREQLGDIAAKLPKLARFSHVKPAWCIYWSQFEDKYLADRLRWQFWTLRFEGSAKGKE